MRTVSYRDVAVLLGGKQNKLIATLDKVTSGLLLGGAVGFEDVLGWFDAKSDFVRLCHELLGSLSENRRSLRRFARTQRIEAAHTVIVTTAFFEALGEFDLPFRLKLDADDELLLHGPVQADPIGRWLRDPATLPLPSRSYDSNLRLIHSGYFGMAARLDEFVRGFSAWDAIDEVGRDKFRAQLGMLPLRAVARYEDLFRRLVVDFPEVACWANLIDHQATRNEVKVGLAGLEQMLAKVVAGRSPDGRRQAMARAHRALLAEPILVSDGTAQEFRIPTVEQAYINPRYRVRWVADGGTPGHESWWDEVEAADDIQRFLVGHLTSSPATRAPLIVLGQPGSGKSMLTKVLSARLPASDFMPVRVVLRDVPAEADVQDQIEHAIRRATGERVEWPELAQAAGDAMPVILFDGFDELLQATRVHQTDYLTRISAFQKREADQGRPVAAIVTTRTAVADLARFPDETLALRLEPFSDDQVRLWTRTWNSENDRIAPLDADTVLRYPELAGQPLLLLMLALYDADGNALRGQEGISHSALYERLLLRFAHREVAKAGAGFPDAELSRRAEQELKRLSVVAFAMFNRGRQWISGEALDKDLAAFGSADESTASQGMRLKLSGAELAIGSFFFIHRASARQAEKRVETYEFLHATFGEYLVARMVWHETRVLAAKAHVAEMSFLDRGKVDDTGLYTLLSFAPLTSRTPVVKFLGQMTTQLPVDERKNVASVLIRLFQSAHDTRREDRRYQPQVLPVPYRHAAYSVNLVILITVLLGEVRGSQLFGSRDNVVVRWMRTALLWRSQLDYYPIVMTLALRRVWHDGERDIELGVSGEWPAVVDPGWSKPDDLSPLEDSDSAPVAWWTWHREETVARRQNFLCSPGDDHLAHLLQPLREYLGDQVNLYVQWQKPGFRAVGHMVLKALLPHAGETTLAERVEVYRWCGRVLGPPHFEIVIDRMRVDTGIPADVVAEVLRERPPSELLAYPKMRASAIRCLTAFLGRDPVADERLLQVFGKLPQRLAEDVEVMLECQLRLFDLDLHERSPFSTDEWQTTSRDFIDSGNRPDLAKRARWMWSQLD
nr:hypothetical protein [Kibdelosporangium sp. MJ126-NF4]CEL16786.1 hypothetical protein [Kibdelosporangium sp. MJ126-NF4]CTQ91985.1 hypothetical protein [Kibdelosporangium sp. MJ126-NF4]